MVEIKRPEWQEEALAVTVAYRLAECGDVIPMITDGTKWEFVEDVLQRMYNADLIEPTKDSQAWKLAKGGHDLLKKIYGMVDAGLKFEIFQHYGFGETLEDGWWDETGKQLKPDIWDPRYSEEASEQEDLRIAMISWMAEKLRRAGKVKQALDPRRIVYLRMLANGELSDESKEFWKPSVFERIFAQVEEIVSSAYQWQDLSDDPVEAFDVAGDLYTAGMLQVQKEQGFSCGECDAPLALILKAGETICPACGADFEPPEPEGDTYDCPNCNGLVEEDDEHCRHCGAIVDFGLPEGTVETTTTTEEIVEEEVYYSTGYVSTGWYHPYDPLADAIAFGIFCAIIF